MIIKARIAGIFSGSPVAAEGEVRLKDGADLEAFFKHADKAMGFGRERHFRNALRMGPAVTLLLNGDRLDLPEGLGHRLQDGDEITVLASLAGG